MRGGHMVAQNYMMPRLFKVQTEDYLESIRILLKNGADVNAKDDMGRTPLSRAQDPRVRKLLIEYGAV